MLQSIKKDTAILFTLFTVCVIFIGYIEIKYEGLLIFLLIPDEQIKEQKAVLYSRGTSGEGGGDIFQIALTVNQNTYYGNFSDTGWGVPYHTMLGDTLMVKYNIKDPNQFYYIGKYGKIPLWGKLITVIISGLCLTFFMLFIFEHIAKFIKTL